MTRGVARGAGGGWRGRGGKRRSDVDSRTSTRGGKPSWIIGVRARRAGHSRHAVKIKTAAAAVQVPPSPGRHWRNRGRSSVHRVARFSRAYRGAGASPTTWRCRCSCSRPVRIAAHHDHGGSHRPRLVSSQHQPHGTRERATLPVSVARGSPRRAAYVRRGTGIAPRRPAAAAAAAVDLPLSPRRRPTNPEPGRT